MLKVLESTLSTFFEMLGGCFEAIFSHKHKIVLVLELALKHIIAFRFAGNKFMSMR